jgi:REP element-mobilizing transposase RayT
VKRAGFRDVGKTLDTFDFDFNRKLDRRMVFDLAAGHFIAKHEDVLFLGPPGTGKSHLAQGIAHAAIQQGHKVLSDPDPETFPRTPGSAMRTFAEAEGRPTSRDHGTRGEARSVRCRGGMTAPRQVLPNATYLTTRRCLDRMFLLRPAALVNSVFEYVLAVKATEYGVLVHAYCVLSNHWHCVLTDPHGRLPEFQRDLGSTIARALNAAHGRWESFWAPGSYSAVALQTADDVLGKMAYVLANPVVACGVACSSSA